MEGCIRKVHDAIAGGVKSEESVRNVEDRDREFCNARMKVCTSLMLCREKAESVMKCYEK